MKNQNTNTNQKKGGNTMTLKQAQQLLNNNPYTTETPENNPIKFTQRTDYNTTFIIQTQYNTEDYQYPVTEYKIIEKENN